MRTLVLSVLVLLLLNACAQVSMVDVQRHQVLGVYGVTPTSTWNRLESGRTVIWTKDGLGLQELVFFKTVGKGETLLQAPPDKTLPKFEPSMRPTDLMDYVLASLSGRGLQAVDGAGSCGPIASRTSRASASR